MQVVSLCAEQQCDDIQVFTLKKLNYFSRGTFPDKLYLFWTPQTPSCCIRFLVLITVLYHQLCADLETIDYLHIFLFTKKIKIKMILWRSFSST